MWKPSNRALSDVPDYLTTFKANNYNDTKRIARSIIDGTFDWQADEDKINIAIYRTLSKYEKPYFRSMFLKHLNDSALKSRNSETELSSGEVNED
jgi:hypothetical protein